MTAPELDRYRSEFEDISREAAALTRGLTEAQFNWRPAAGEWSIEECMAHLTMVGQWQIGEIERAIDDARNRGLSGSGPFRYGSIDRFILRVTEPPVRRRARSPRRFVPLHGQPLTAIMPTFFHLQSQFVQQIQRAEGLDLARVKVRTAIWIRMSLGMIFAQQAAHERRHLEQAGRVRQKLPESLGFGVEQAPDNRA